MSRFNKVHAGWIVKIWVVATVFVLPFLSSWEALAWVAMGGVFGLAWKLAPEGPPEKPVEPLPYQHLYTHKQVPRRDAE
jgi:hypothetical protein